MRQFKQLKQLRDVTESFIILLLNLYMMSKLLICINKTQFHLPVSTGKIFFHKMCKDFNMLLTRNFFLKRSMYKSESKQGKKKLGIKTTTSKSIKMYCVIYQGH